MADIVIRAAEPHEADALTAIALRSKAHWGYSQELIDLWASDLAVDPARCDGESTWLITLDNVIVGFGEIDGNTARLDDLWIDPPYMKMGLGRLLLQQSMQNAADRGCTGMEFEAEPHAVGFYERMGAQVIGEHVSESVPGRVLPIMRIDLSSTTIDPM